MNRREFVQQGLAVTMAAALKSSAKTRPPKTRPNVLYVFSDEHRTFSLPGDRFSSVLAPNIDAFRRQNLSMEQCISTYPLCSPHRAILLTGLWPFQNGVMRNGIKLGTEVPSIGETFRRSGYRTAYVGKWHLSGTSDPTQLFVPKGPDRQGFEDWHVWGSTNKHFDASYTFDQDTGEKILPKGYNATLMTDQAVEFIHKQTKEQPWMLIVSWNPPHPKFEDAPKEEIELYDPGPLKFRPNVKVGYGTGELSTEENLRNTMRGYFAHITAIDREFGRLLKALDETGQADNTIVVYTSDHGEMMGSHGRMHKRVPHEESCRVPFFIRYPGVTPKNANSDLLFASIDIYPSMCALAGVPIPSHCKGMDLSGAMRGEKIIAPEAAFLINQMGGIDEGNQGLPPPVWRGVRTQTHTYAVAEDGRWFLFDNVNDPYQQMNLIEDPKQGDLLARFDTLILNWLKESADPFPYREAIVRRSSAPA
jgi:arylsulfatase A-like enzyme